MAIVITYETLFDILRKESSREDLQALPQAFLTDVKTFLDEKKAEGGKNQRVAIEYENSKKILRELYERRERKILLMSLNKARTESAIIDQSSFLAYETTLFNSLVTTLKENKKNYLSEFSISGARFSASAPPQISPVEKPEPTPSGEVILQEPGAETDGVRVKFLKAIPKFIGRDMTIFGPFNEGEETQLPEEVANVLLTKGHVTLEITSTSE